ncbi:MAG: Bifunctional protein folD [uncultured bacterium]|nr:MAG: Bifunctional protein folD [uncultured bacterium]
MKLLFGKPVAEKILSRLKSDISLLEKKPGLAVILIGTDSASHIYVNLKEKMAREIGMNFFRFDFSEGVSQDEISTLIDKLNADADVHGVIVQLPLPESFDTEKIIASIAPEKDVDGFHPENSKAFLEGEGAILPVFPRAITLLMQSAEENLAGKKAVILANSAEFGMIMSTMLSRQNIDAEYILAEKIPSNLRQIKGADIVVSAMGSPELVKGEMLKDGAIVIDGGIEKVGEKVFGDVDFGSTETLSGHITPVPGGVGPVTIACLLDNVFLAFEAQQR